MQQLHAQTLEAYIARLEIPLSSDRLDSYLTPGGTRLDQLTDYYWNIALSEALYPSLNAVEIALRNSIHAGLTRRFRSEEWFDDPRVLMQSQRNSIIAAEDWLGERGKPATTGRVIAQLSFGFWVTLLNKPYEERIWEPDGFALLRTAFPHLPRKQRKRWLVQKRFFAINALRNRVMHHEPIWASPNLGRMHAEILEAIGWISSDLRESIAWMDRFPDVYGSGRARVEAGIRKQLGIP